MPTCNANIKIYKENSGQRLFGRSMTSIINVADLHLKIGKIPVYSANPPGKDPGGVG